METVYKSFRTVILFVVMVLVAQAVAGDKFTQTMCIVIFIAMLIPNSTIFTNVIEGVSNGLRNF